MKNNPLIIPLSFKSNNQNDLELYNWIQKQQYKSAFIKTILRQIMKEDLTKNT